MSNISRLEKNDLKAAYVLGQTSHRYPWSKNLFVNLPDEHYLNLKLLDNNNTMIGFIITQIVLDEASLLNIAICPRVQHQGYGTKLIGSLVASLKKKQISTLWLDVRVNNFTAIAFYRKLGFHQVSLRRGYYPTSCGFEDALILSLAIC